ncbi:S-adenosyl-L-methionine-dependent methyltransferase, partial [Blyttiomyces helicus]
LWNAGLSMTKYLDKNKSIYTGKNVLELGAAAALPTLMCAINGARTVVSTDYPDPAVIKNIERNARENAPGQVEAGALKVVGFIWGQPVEDLFAALPSPTDRFDLIILADLIFNHTEHANLLKTCAQCLAPGGVVLTTFTHHVVKWADRDMKFFEIAAADPLNFEFEKLYEDRHSPMFPDDDGDLDVRSTVHAYRLTRKA